MIAFKLPGRAKRRLQRWAMRYTTEHRPDRYIGGYRRPYMLRWIVVRSWPLSIYLHEFRRSDDARAMHDHPADSLGVILRGGYDEVYGPGEANVTRRDAGDVVLRAAHEPHRIELWRGDRPLTLFVFGPRRRQWGFHCPQGWRPWRLFVDPRDPDNVGPGCD